MQKRYQWFDKFLASLWLFSIIMLGFGINHAFVSEIRDFHGKLGLLKRPTTEAIEWKIDTFVKSLFQPVDTFAVDAVVCVGGCLSGETYLASRASERAEITLLRSILTAFVRTILNFIQDTVLTIIKQLTNAQDQFNFLKTIGQYAEQAVLLASKQAYNCASDSITTWSYNLFGDKPPETSKDSCKFGFVNTSNPTDTDVIGSAQDAIDQCTVLNFASVKPPGCTDSDIQEIRSESDEAIKEKIYSQCLNSYSPPQFNSLAGSYSCSAGVVENLSRIRQQSEARVEKVKQNASQYFSNYKTNLGSDAAFITADNAQTTPTATNFTTSTGGTNSASPAYFPTDNFQVFDPNTSSTQTLQIGFAKDPEANKLINDYTIAGINSKPQPSGESDNLATVIQDAFKGFLDQLLQKLQEMLFSFLNSLIAKLDVAAGGNGIFSSLLSDVTGAVKTYAKTKVDNLYNDITSQREALINSIGQKRKVINSSTQDIINSNIAFIA